MRLIDADALLAQLEYLLKTREDDAKYSGCRGAVVTWNDAIYAIKIAPTIEPQHWIPVSERLPECNKEVLCQCRAGIIEVLRLDSDGDWCLDKDHFYMGGFVIAWMPIPEPYKGEQK